MTFGIKRQTPLPLFMALFPPIFYPTFILLQLNLTYIKRILHYALCTMHSCHLGKSTQLSTQIKTYASTAYFVDAGADAAVVYTPCYYKVFSPLMLCFLF